MSHFFQMFLILETLDFPTPAASAISLTVIDVFINAIILKRFLGVISIFGQDNKPPTVVPVGSQLSCWRGKTGKNINDGQGRTLTPPQVVNNQMRGCLGNPGTHILTYCSNSNEEKNVCLN
ncbi:hypothetical protein WA026_003156 [Henosepilachna vigintioctopunctata]|uniref:Uncharacterized protein n=1 Tax=Henosepilachna vigintioctopunctata TaxID=420089 RepID=A0AAW1TLG5_9CUCU